MLHSAYIDKEGMKYKMLEIYVDADACPVKDEVLKVALRHNLKCYFVSNIWLRNLSGPRVEMIVVSEGADQADDWIVEHIQKHDIFITADILLADRCVKREAAGLSPTGKPFSKDTIGSAVALRNLNTHLRETGDISGHNRAFSKKDRSTFLQELERTIQLLKRL